MGAGYWEKLTQTRVSRRRVLQAGATGAAVAGAWWLTGCGSGSSRPPAATPGLPPLAGDPTKPDILNPLDPPVRGGRYVVSLAEPFDTFDPHRGVAGSTDFFPRLYNSLVNQSNTRPEFFFNDLAESFENPDERTWTFTLRPGVRIGPNELGVPERDLTGDDVVATFDRIKNDAATNNGAFVKQYVETVRADGLQVTITTTRPYAWFLSRVGSYFNTITPRELLATDSAIESMRDRSAGAGAYTLFESAEGEGARMERNPAYYRRDERGEQLPFIDGLDALIITDPAAARAALISGQIDAYYPEGKAEADQLLNRDLFLETMPGSTFISAVMHPDKAPFTDARARRALALAINRDQYVTNVYRGDARPNGLVHWTLGSYAFTGEELAAKQPFDLTEARALADAVGGLSVPFLYPASVSLDQHDAHVVVFVEQMRAAGIELEPQPLDLSTWLSRYAQQDYVLTLALNQVYETPEMPLDFHRTGGPLGDGTYAPGLGDADVDTAIDLTKETLDLEERRLAVLGAQETIWARDPAFLPLVTPYRYRLHASRVRNMPSGIGSSYLWLTTMWLQT